MLPYARIGKQLYKGVHLDAFQACVDNTAQVILQR
jgi:hypothetical protein